jgi:hypothetical protein
VNDEPALAQQTRMAHGLRRMLAAARETDEPLRADEAGLVFHGQPLAPSASGAIHADGTPLLRRLADGTAAPCS